MRLLIISLLMTINFGLFSQSVNVDLIGQGNKDEVKLMWRPVSWPENLQGFNVKRQRNGAGSWEQLNTELIVPSITSASLTSNDSEVVARITAKRDSLIRTGNIGSTDPEYVRENFLPNQQGIRFLNLLLTGDYDYGLILGLAYYDLNIPSARSYTYGLFPVVDNIEQSSPLATYTWNFGSSPDLTVNFQSEVNKLRKKRGIEVKWFFDQAAIEDKDIKGFHMYLEDSLGNVERITETPRLATKAETSEKMVLIHYDPSYDLSKTGRFIARPVNIFNTTGDQLSISYSENNYAVLEAPALLQVDAQQGSKNVNLNWDFNPLNEQKIVNFQILRRRDINSPSLLIGEVDANQRNFTDSDLIEDGYYLYRIAAITTSYKKMESNEVLTVVDSNRPVTPPSSITGKVIEKAGKKYIRLNWDTPASGNAIGGYQLYVDAFNTGEVARQGDLPPIVANFYEYEVYNRFGKKYDFAISSIDENGTESPLSEKITVYIPSETLPKVNIWPVNLDNNVITLDWKYSDEIDDLEGFRLYQNGELILDEEDLPADSRQWKSGELKPGNYIYTIQAVSRFDVKSQNSQPRNFKVKSAN